MRFHHRKSCYSCCDTLSMILVISILFSCRQLAAQDRFPSAHESPPAGWTGPVFELSQDFPSTTPAAEQWPWEVFDFKTQPNEYLDAVLRYVYEGNIGIDCKVQTNLFRTWYHAPWLHVGESGREFIHGMTRERNSRPHELDPNQSSTFQNWAVGFYNPPGGFVLGKVWEDENNPDASKAVFPNGTVAAKLLFTAATVAEVPFLEDTFEWQGNINTTNTSTARSPQTVRLLQIDVAVRDKRADATTGWVFGTFVYHKDHTGITPWDRMRPVGLMWGNDPDVTPDMVQNGTTLQETWLNPQVTLVHYGWAGRLNGPVDNPISSCLSCHSTAQIPTSSPMTFRNSDPISTKLRWFRNIKAGEPFDTGSQSTDYSLQIAKGILNLIESQQPAPLAAAPAATNVREDAMQPKSIGGRTYYPVTRGE